MLPNYCERLKNNKIRTNLLILTNEENKHNLKTSKTKINSKSYKEYEKEFFHIVVNLGEQYFNSDFMSNFTYTSNQLSTIDNSIRSLSDVNEHNRINSFFEYLKNLNTKRNISEKKLKLDNKKENLKKNFVRSNSNIFENSLYTLNNSCEQRNKFMNNETDKISLIINYLNRENNFLIDENVGRRVKRGFLYLQSLVYVLKNIKYKNIDKLMSYEEIRENFKDHLIKQNDTKKLNLTVLKQILLIKENMDEKQVLDRSYKRHSTNNNGFQNNEKNQPKNHQRNSKRHKTQNPNTYPTNLINKLYPTLNSRNDIIFKERQKNEEIDRKLESKNINKTKSKIEGKNKEFEDCLDMKSSNTQKGFKNSICLNGKKKEISDKNLFFIKLKKCTLDIKSNQVYTPKKISYNSIFDTSNSQTSFDPFESKFSEVSLSNYTVSSLDSHHNSHDPFTKKIKIQSHSSNRLKRKYDKEFKIKLHNC